MSDLADQFLKYTKSFKNINIQGFKNINGLKRWLGRITFVVTFVALAEDTNNRMVIHYNLSSVTPILWVLILCLDLHGTKNTNDTHMLVDKIHIPIIVIKHLKLNQENKNLIHKWSTEMTVINMRNPSVTH